MAAGGSTKAVLAALIGNSCIAVAKFVGYLITRSSTMLAESIHSVADAGNQALLLFGGKKAKKQATKTHQFGFGRERYFWSFVVALILFVLGSAFATYHGIEKILHPEKIENVLVAIVILLVAIVIEGFAFRTAVKESIPLKGNLSWWQFIRKARTPELPVILLEDLGAMVGLVIAFITVLIAKITDQPIWDGIGSLAIGILLGVIAIILLIEMRSLLLGEGATEEQMLQIEKAIQTSDSVTSIIHMRTQYLGPEELLVAAKVVFDKNLDTEQLASSIDALEANIRTTVPLAKPIYIEPDLRREQA